MSMTDTRPVWHPSYDTPMPLPRPIASHPYVQSLQVATEHLESFVDEWAPMVPEYELGEIRQGLDHLHGLFQVECEKDQETLFDA